MVYNSLLWWLTLPQQLAWMDLVCTWMTPVTAAVNAITFTVSVPDTVVQRLAFKPWALFWQTLAMASVITCLHAASLRAFYQHVKRTRSQDAAPEHGGRASTSTGLSCDSDNCWPVKRPAAMLESGLADCCSGCVDKHLQHLRGVQAAVKPCRRPAARLSRSEEAVPAQAPAQKGEGEIADRTEARPHHRPEGDRGQGQEAGGSVLPYTGLLRPEGEEEGLQVLDPRAVWGLEPYTPHTACSDTAAGGALGQAPATGDGKWVPDPMAAPPVTLPAAAAGAEATALAVGVPGSALEEALRLVRAQKLMTYSPVLECCQVHVRLEGMEPEQLQPGWQVGLAERLSDHGWCLLNVAVRRGSIYVSFTLVRAAGANDGEADDAAAQPATAAADEGAAAAAQLARTGAAVAGASVAAGVSMELGMMARPEQLLLQMGLRREQLLDGFSMTVQAVTDDGQLQRLRYTLQPDGLWVHEPLDRLPDEDDGQTAADADELDYESTSFADWASGESAVRSSDFFVQLPSSGDAEATSSDSAGWDVALLPHGCASHPNMLHSSVTAAGSGAPRAVAEATEAPGAEFGSDARLLRAAQGDAAAVQAGPRPGPGDGTARVGATARGVREAVHDMVLSAARQPTLQQRPARQPARAAAAAPSMQWALQMPDVLVGTSSTSGAQAGLPLYEAVVQVNLANGARAAQPSVNAAAGASMPPAPHALGPLEALKFRVRPLGRVGGLCELHVEQVALPQQLAEPTGRAGAWSLAIMSEQAPETAAFRENAAGTAAGGADAAAEGRPHLVDVSLWRGHDLLAARVVLLVPPEPRGLPQPLPHAGAEELAQALPSAAAVRADGAAAAGQHWMGELLEVLQGQPTAGAQHLLVDLGLLLSGAFNVVAAGSAPPQQQPQSRAEPTGQPTASSGLEVVLSRRLRAAQQTLLVLDMGCGLLSLVLQCGAAHLAEYLWRTLQGMGFGAEELLLHACGAGGDLPPLHAAMASGEPPAVDLVVSWYRAAQLPEPWLQPAAVAGAPAVLTPLVLASASQPPGALLWHTLCVHPGALAAWRVPVNGVSARATAAAAGLWRVVLAVDAYCALAPAMTRASAVLPVCFSLAGGLAWSGQHPGAPQTERPRSAGTKAAAADSDAKASAAAVAGNSDALSPVAAMGPPGFGAAAASSAPPAAKSWKFLSGGIAVMGSTTSDFNTYLATRSRTGKLVLRWTVVVFQILSHLRALTTGFAVSCPAAAGALRSLSASGSAATSTSAGAAVGAASSAFGAALLSYATAGHALLRCVAGRYWWTVVEVLAVLWVSLPAALRRHDAVCALITLLHACYQGLEGTLLPPSGMKAQGAQMLTASIVFNLFNAAFNVPSTRSLLAMRMLEAVASMHIFLRYGVTESPAMAALLAAGVSAASFATSVCMRQRALAAWRREQGPSPLQQPGENGMQAAPCRSAVPDTPVEGSVAATVAGPSAVVAGVVAAAAAMAVAT
ncbi:hypothetical protein HYH02_005274 [Chlamydomonas schloesseri]|uniref:Uncharacterized protein n=1 Tax=Chlamydomonas schloesseri TaxID=2026947 RepID=A0A835WM52_9CHLO|nr:hypothetical protein HYH02_005274 [Chlamydomonas schloesseri]|eukprot:KAG2449749.1 hypothetical protein HYH02_005274 [Chlamydomonas schloesseri]